MRSQRFFQLPGVSFVAIALQTGRANGIEIDNSSGSWLFIPSMETYIPPFTIGWSMDFPYAVTSVDIQATNGPAGQVSTTQGTGVTVYLFDDKVGSSPGSADVAGITRAGGSPDAGSAFIQGFTPLIQRTNTVLIPYSTGFDAIIIAGTTGKRIRMRSVEFTLQPFSGVPPINWDSAVAVQLWTDTLDNVVTRRLTTETPSQAVSYDAGLSLGVGEAIHLQAFADLATSTVAWSIGYELI